MDTKGLLLGEKLDMLSQLLTMDPRREEDILQLIAEIISEISEMKNPGISIFLEKLTSILLRA